MLKIVPRIGTCDAGFSSSKFLQSCLPFVVKQSTLPVSSQLLLSRTTVDSNFFHGPIEFEITRVNCSSNSFFFFFVFNIYIFIWRTISGYSHCPRVVVRTSGNDIARAGGEGNISFKVRITTQGQSVYPDISLHISNYCVYCIEDQNLTHNIMHRILGTAILGINKTLQTHK